jgi:hypothetical protein
MDKKKKEGQGYNDARGEIPDKKDIPSHNGQNVNNDPAHKRANEKEEEEDEGFLKKAMRNEEGKVGYIIAWIVGVPIPILLLVFLLRGCN